MTAPPVGTGTGVTRLVLARHGETVWHGDNRYAGGLSDIDLTPRGRRQARQLAEWAADRVDAVVSSPVRRAVETATPVATAVGVRLHVVDGLREVDFGIAEGHTITELQALDAEMVRRFRADPVAHPFPGAESPKAAARRLAQALRTVAERHVAGTVLVVAHNTALRLGICELLDLPISRYRQIFPRLDNAALTEVVLTGDEHRPASLLSLNVPAAALAGSAAEP